MLSLSLLNNDTYNNNNDRHVVHRTYKLVLLKVGGKALFLFISIHLCSRGAAQPLCEPWAAKAISVQGNVELQRAGKARWKKVILHDVFCAGDSVRVDMRSRAAILLQNQTLLRLDEGTTVTFSKIEQDKPSWLDLLKGAVHFISRTPKYFRVNTPFVNAAIEGTEFAVRVKPVETAIWVFEGQVTASNPLGGLKLASGEAAIAKKSRAPERRIVVKPREAVQWALYYPPIIDLRIKAYATGPDREAIRAALERYRIDDLPGAFVALGKVPENQRTASFYNLSAGLLLTVGRVDNARVDIDKALKLDPRDATAYALKSIIAVTQNEHEKAFDLAQKAADLDPQSPTAQVALSYAYQALFKIEKARDSVEKAVILDTENALAWARLAELELSLGYLDKALAAAQKAKDLDPGVARTQTVLGFANLTLINIDEAKTAFEKAIELDPAAPLPRLGLGLAMIRRSDLDEGTKEIEIAAILDPDNSLIRSYLGKAYFEQKRIALARTEFEIAKELDTNDPTPWFYSAILKQTENQPVEALQDLRKSIELNDNRAVYRSSLLLDQDEAARSASLGRIYNDLGFQQLGLLEGWKSVNTDPSNYSAHRLLADNYAVLPRHDIARVSELLQSQLLQPLNINNLQPQLAETSLRILEGAGPSTLSFNEFNPLFTRNRLALQVDGLAGNNDTFADDVIVSGIHNRFSYSFGQFHYETDGFRNNNDLEHDIYNVFLQGLISPRLNLQAEYRRRETKQGDLILNFDPDNFSLSSRRKVKQDTVRVGGRASLSPGSDFVFSGFYADRDSAVDQSPIFARTDSNGHQVEAQYIFRQDWFNVTVGGGKYEVDADRRFQFPTSELKDKMEDKHDNAYLYANLTLPREVVWTVGVSYDSYEAFERELDKFSPKVGLQWNLTETGRLRLAYLETVKRVLIFDQTIEPTQIASFNQFFDDINGTETERYGIGFDVILADALYGGVEYSRRDLNVPAFSTSQMKTATFNRWEDLSRAYLYWTPHSNWAFSAQGEFERFKRSSIDPDVALSGEPTKVETVTLPLAIRYFHPSGFFAALGGTFVRQEVDLAPTSTFNRSSDEFYLVDAFIGYRLPKRRGIVSLETRNLLDEEFLFQDSNIQTAGEAVNPRFIPDQAIFVRATLVIN